MIKKLLTFIIICSSNIFAQNALDFDGVNDFVNTSYSGISGSSPRTVEAWIKTTANADPNAGGSQKTILDWGTFATGRRFTFNILWNNAIRLEAQGNGLSGSISVNDGNWHHVAAVYDPNATNKVSLYVDGVLDVAGNLTVSVNTGSTLPVRIGRRIDENNSFVGSIDEVRIWNVAKTQTQIEASMDQEFCGPQTNLMAYYKCNEGIANSSNTSISTIADSSGNNYTGTLGNFALSGTTSNFVTGATLTQNLINTVTSTGNTLSADTTGATYQWLDCDNANAPISGATSQTYTPIANGNYAVQITLGDCSATSTCTPVTLSSENFSFKNSISMFPNPTNGITNIQLNQSFETIEATVYNVTGQTILNKEFNNTNTFSVDINSSNGIYFLAIKTNSGENAVLKVVKE